MPIYEYSCEECRSVFELFIRSGNDRVACPSCSSKRVAKLFSTFAVRSRGGSPAGSPSGSSCSTCSGGNCSTCH